MECIDPFGEPLPKIIRKRRGSKWVRMDPPHLVSRDHLFKGSKIKQAWAKACIRNGAPLAVPSKGGSLTKDQMIDRNAGPPLTPEMVPPLVSRFKTWLTTIIDASALLAYERHKYGIVYHHRVSAAKAANGFCPVRARDIHAAIRHLYPEYLPALTSGADGGDDAIAEDETFDTDEMDGEEDDGATKAAEDGEPEEQDDAEDDEEEGMDVDEDG
ncbi:uncharacterized protein EV422DRAFT_162838 [Fimicolochytrium jonesii]|uniref:uncharacterized protein n=1 Tax=Fimicolochytrium jonesii TaxID=1396493 RepID=UPI0022FE1DC2|nr:uncharacterized protein EV422DRAFT_162838 [Fimicolochytrium jonesii]KAI8818724.1 hypothetical protein EV422DRAFT_162838 [Fimicolochytrium jonesii]